MNRLLHSAFFFLFLFTFFRVISGATFTITNKCDYTVWPGILSSSGSPPLQATGFELGAGAAVQLQAPPGWSGRVWGRTRCTFDANTGQGTCATGDCGSGQIQCNGAGAIPLATLAEFTISSGAGAGAGSASQDFYDVSLVDGFNLPMVVDPSGGSGSCLAAGCSANLNQRCPPEPRAADGGACRSACEAFGTEEYCCSGAHATPETCGATAYSQMFKTVCPRAYSYAYDDPTSTFTCGGADYSITFCPALTSQKSSTEISPPSQGVASGSQSGSGDPPMIVAGGVTSGSWLSNILSSDGGHSLISLSKFAWHLTLLASTTSILALHYITFVYNHI